MPRGEQLFVDKYGKVCSADRDYRVVLVDALGWTPEESEPESPFMRTCNVTLGIHLLSLSFLLSIASVSVKFPRSHDHTKDCKTYCHPIVL